LTKPLDFASQLASKTSQPGINELQIEYAKSTEFCSIRISIDYDTPCFYALYFQDHKYSANAPIKMFLRKVLVIYNINSLSVQFKNIT
jgi:hypothetical protein